MSSICSLAVLSSNMNFHCIELEWRIVFCAFLAVSLSAKEVASGVQSWLEGKGKPIQYPNGAIT